MSKLLILGGSGFIGSHLADRAIELGFNVDVISTKKPSIDTYNEKIKYILLNLNDLSQVEQFQNLDYDYVVNLSGYINHSNFSKDGRSVINTHFVAIQKIIEKLLKKKLKRFVQIGSSDEYGIRQSPQSEDMREDPISPYSFSKMAISHFLQMLNKTENFPCVILRLFLVYGPRQNLNRFIPQVINGCLNNQTFDTSLGNQIRDFCYVEDVIKAILISLDQKKAIGNIINIGSGIPIKISEVIKLINNIIKKGKPNIGGLQTDKIENPSLYADIQKANDILNWMPSVDLEDGLRLTIKYYSR